MGEEILERLLKGDAKTAARLITRAENEDPEIRGVMQQVYRHGGKSYIIGVTGAPGVGKSTLIDQMIGQYRKQEKSVGVIAVDPSSPFSGGAALADRVRMNRHFQDPGVYIRSMASRGYLGGIARATMDAISILDAMGKDVIMVETVGVGQGELDIMGLAHSVLLVLAPGGGDAMQALKAGILEIADVFVVNKAKQAGASSLITYLKEMLSYGKKKAWLPPIVKCEALDNDGVEEVMAGLAEHRAYLHETPAGLERKKQQALQYLVECVKRRAVKDFEKRLEPKREEVLEALAERRLDPYEALDLLFGTKGSGPVQS